MLIVVVAFTGWYYFEAGFERMLREYFLLEAGYLYVICIFSYFFGFFLNRG